jgi:hypothetical protein
MAFARDDRITEDMGIQQNTGPQFEKPLPDTSSGSIAENATSYKQLPEDSTAPHARPTSVAPPARSQAAYMAELPELLKSHRGKWVAFADGKMLRLGNSRAELYRHCLNDLGLPHERFVVRRIIPESSPQIEYNLR